MKKILLGIALSVVVLQGCKKDDDDEEIVVLTVEEQKAYDDAAAKDFLTKNYLNSKGVITPFSTTTDTDDNEKKLIDYDYKTLPSGVIYIVIPNAQPDPGKEIANPSDVLTLMQVVKTYISTKVDDKIIFGGEAIFSNSVATGNATIDPGYFYMKNSVITKYNKDNGTTYGRDFFEIEGFQEGLKYFKSFELDPSANYNMQGIIIVPSRAAYARDNNVYGVSYNNRSFVFNFQLYDAKTRLSTED